MEPEDIEAAQSDSQETGDTTPEKFGFPPLDPVQTRVLGVLVEKALSTPDYYPLTLKATVNACNQKSNRQPVMEVDEKTVSRALDRLREKHLIWMLHTAGSRTVKYEHKLQEKIFVADRAALAVLGELLLRGPQTPGQLRTRADRMHMFSDKEAVQAVLDNLAGRGVPLVMRLGHQAGQKEDRYMHLLAGTPDLEEWGESSPEPVQISATEDAVKLAELEGKVNVLEETVARLEAELAAFRKQFD